MRHSLILVLCVAVPLALGACQRAGDCVDSALGACGPGGQAGMAGSGGTMTGGTMTGGTMSGGTMAGGGEMMPAPGGMTPGGASGMGGRADPPADGRCPAADVDANADGVEDRLEPAHVAALCELLFDCVVDYCETEPAGSENEFMAGCERGLPMLGDTIDEFCDDVTCEASNIRLESVFRDGVCADEPSMMAGAEIPRGARNQETGPTVCVQGEALEVRAIHPLEWPPPPTHLGGDTVWMSCDNELQGGPFALEGVAQRDGLYTFTIEEAWAYEDPTREVDALDLMLSIRLGRCQGGTWEVGCNDDPGGASLNPRLSVILEAGTAYTVFVAPKALPTANAPRVARPASALLRVDVTAP